MTFQEKSTAALTGVLALVFGGYFALVIGQIADSPARDVAYRGLMVPTVLLLVLLAVVTHAVIAATAPGAAGEQDERDRLIALRGEHVGGYVLAVGTVAGLGLTMLEAEPFWIAQVLLAGLVLAEVTAGTVRLVLYRRSG